MLSHNNTQYQNQLSNKNNIIQNLCKKHAYGIFENEHALKFYLTYFELF